MTTRIPVHVLTGFLGSGKTTILNRVLGRAGGAKTLVVVNEFGEIGLDHDLVESSDEDTVLLQNGCVCCTVRNDLVETLRAAHRRRELGAVPRFERVVIETTGLAEPAPILQSLIADPAVAAFYRLDGVVTAVDAASAWGTLDLHPEAVKQVALADRLALTKTDLSTNAEIAALRARLATINPGAPVVIAHNGATESDDVFANGASDLIEDEAGARRWLRGRWDASEAGGHADRVSTVSFAHDRPIPGETLDRWFQSLFLLRGPNLLRFKAIVNVAELPTPLVAQGVQHVIHPPVVLKRWPSADRRTRMVFITHNLDGESILTTLRAMLAEPAAAPG